MCNVVLGFNVCFQVAGMFVLHVNGLRSLLMSLRGLDLGIGITLAPPKNQKSYNLRYDRLFSIPFRMTNRFKNCFKTFSQRFV